jgi:hypothetical protein
MKRVAIALVVLLFGVNGFIFGGQLAARKPSHDGPNAVLSILALGDTGRRHRPLPSLSEGQIAVANALAMEDRHHPSDGLIFLGDQFYWHGLLKSELVERLAENLVYPYCYFLALDGPRSAEVAEACGIPESRRHSIPLLAVLGNHDLETAESPALQQKVIPQFITNWDMPAAFASVRELGQGVSLVLIGSEDGNLDSAKGDQLMAALQSARGPWRILVAHTPIVVDHDSRPPSEGHVLELSILVRDAIERAGVTVHLYLAGHNHNLQVLKGDSPSWPALHVVAGGGARWRSIDNPHPDRLFGLARLGFARIDLVESGADSRLVASLFRAPTIPLLAWGGGRLVARYSVDMDGVVRDELEMAPAR